MNDEVLRRLAESVADGTPTPWPDDSAHPHVAGLRHLRDLAGAFRIRAGGAPRPSRQVLFQWRHLDVLEHIGKGGFGDVYRAYDPLLRRDVALKLINDQSTPTHATGLIAAEARRMARLRHPAILAIHGADEQDGRLGIWSDLLVGRTLEVLLEEREKLHPATVLELAVPLCEALRAVHGKALTHGDFKPANIMIQDDGTPVLMDFGAAREVMSENVTLGSPLVMAPELFDHARASPAADMYAFGAVVYRMLSGRYPVQADNLTQLRNRLLDGQPPDLRVLPRQWRALVGDLLARSPEARPDTDAVLVRLERMRTARQRRFRRLAIAAVIASLSLGLVIATLGYREALKQRDRAQSTAATLFDVLESPRPSRSGRHMSALDLLHDLRPRVQAMLPDHPALHARVMLELADTFLYFDEVDSVRRLDDAALQACVSCAPRQQAQLEMRRHHQLTEAALIQRHMRDAEQHARAALDLARRLYPDPSPQRAYAMAKLGDVLLAQRRLKQAGPWLKSAMKMSDKVTWTDPEQQAFLRGTWLTWLTSTGSMRKAEAWARKQVAWTQATFGLRHSSTLSAHQGLNRILIQTSQLDEAARRLDADIDLASNWLGRTDATTLGLRLEKASLLNQQGRRQQSIRLLEGIRNEILASDEPDTEALMVASGNLASGYKDVERYAEAEKMYDWVIDKTTKSLGPEHPRVLLNRANLAEMRLAQGRPKQALESSMDIEHIAAKAIGANHLISHFAGFIEGRSLVALGRYREGIAKLRSARHGLEAKLGKDSKLAMRAGYHLAQALAAAGQRAQARSLVDELLPRAIKVLGKEHADVHDLVALRNTLE